MLERASSLGNVERLIDALNCFRCSRDTDIEMFLRKRAVEFLRRGWCSVYLILDEDAFDNGELKIIAYFTLSNKVLDLPYGELSKSKVKEVEFIEAITKGLEFVAQSPQLLTLGIKPSRPETGYGYIQIAEEKDGIFYKVKTFIEKPQLEFAQVFVESNEFYWNSGIFLWNVNTILKAFETHIPEICETFKSYENDLEALPNISIDYAIMEKAENVYVQICNFGWADLGTWGALHEASPKDQHKNVIMKGHTLLYECKDNIIAIPKGKLAVLQGLEDYLIADTDNVLLVCRKDDENSIRRYVNDVQVKLGDEFV